MGDRDFFIASVTEHIYPTEQSLKRELLKALIPSGMKEPKRANFIE